MGNTEKQTNHLHIFTPDRWIDSRTSPALEEQFNDAIAHGINNMVVDCREIDYISGAGLRAICNTAKKLRNINGTIILCALEDYVKEVFEISGLDSLMVIEKNLDDAIIHLTREANA